MVGRLFQNSNNYYIFIQDAYSIHSFKTCNFHSRFLCIKDAEYSFKMCNFHASAFADSWPHPHYMRMRIMYTCKRRCKLLFKSFCFHYDITPLFSLATPTCGCVHDKCLWFYCIGVVVLIITGNGVHNNQLPPCKVIPKPVTWHRLAKINKRSWVRCREFWALSKGHLLCF